MGVYSKIKRRFTARTNQADKPNPIGEKFLIKEFSDGNRTVARVLAVKGRFFKKYECAVWGEYANGQHNWPNGSVSCYINILEPRELTQRLPALSGKAFSQYQYAKSPNQ